MALNLLIIEPNPLIRRTLHEFYSNSLDFSIIGKLHDASSAERRTWGVVPDILIFDVSDDFKNDIEALRSAFAGFYIPILFFSNQSDEFLSNISNRLGSLDWGVINKPTIKIVQNTTPQNTTEAQVKFSTLTASELQAATRANEYDIELYEFAQEVSRVQLRRLKTWWEERQEHVLQETLATRPKGEYCCGWGQ